MTIQQTLFGGIIKGYQHANITVQIWHLVSVVD